jgi:hypothetical protein
VHAGRKATAGANGSTPPNCDTAGAGGSGAVQVGDGYNGGAGAECYARSRGAARPRPAAPPLGAAVAARPPAAEAARPPAVGALEAAALRFAVRNGLTDVLLDALLG